MTALFAGLMIGAFSGVWFAYWNRRWIWPKHFADGYSPDYQDEYQRLWHRDAARAKIAETAWGDLDDAIRDVLDVTVGWTRKLTCEEKMSRINASLNEALERSGAQKMSDPPQQSDDEIWNEWLDSIWRNRKLS